MPQSSQPRDPNLIRRDALAGAIRKLAGGCDTCAEGYFNLARQYGATEEEIQDARAKGQSQFSTAGSRRNLLFKAATVGAGTIAGAAALGGLLEASHPALAGGVSSHAPQGSRECSEPVSAVSGQKNQHLLDQALQNKDVQLLKKFIEHKGFRFSSSNTRGLIGPGDKVSELLFFESENESKDFALIAWSHSPQLPDAAKGDIIHPLGGDPKSIHSGEQLLNHLHITGLLPNTGEVLAFSVTPENRSTDFFSCIVAGELTCTGFLVLSCFALALTGIGLIACIELAEIFELACLAMDIFLCSRHFPFPHFPSETGGTEPSAPEPTTPAPTPTPQPTLIAIPPTPTGIAR